MRFFYTVMLAITALAFNAKADVTGSILGTVHDPSGGLLVGIGVTATQVETNVAHQTATDSSGSYHFLALPAGTYTIEAKHAGFQDFVANRVILRVNQEYELDVVMQLGPVSSKVEVTANAAQVETTSTQLGDVIEEHKMEALPLNGRSYIDLLGPQAGVASAPPPGSERSWIAFW